MTIDIMLTYGVLLLAIILFVSEKLRTDLVAVLIMVLLPWTGVITVDEAFSGFASDAVISIIGVMLIGYGIEKSGVMGVIAKLITDNVGTKEKNIMATTSATAGVISSFMQNIGAAALFLPTLRRVGKRAKIAPSKLIMPMGYAAILGGTLTMVASGPLIILNDLLGDAGYDSFHLFAVTPIGVALLAGGILYFYLLGHKVLPGNKEDDSSKHDASLQHVYNLPEHIYECTIPEENALIDQSIESLNIWQQFGIHIIGIYENGSFTYTPWRQTRIRANQTLALLGDEEQIRAFTKAYNLSGTDDPQIFTDVLNDEFAGFAELIVPPKSAAAGRTLAELGLRKNYHVEPVAYIGPDGEQFNVLEDEMTPGLEIIVFGRWEDIDKLKQSETFVVMSNVKQPDPSSGRDLKKPALISLAVSLTLVLFGFPLPISFFTGAMMMILFGVIPKNEIYSAIDWKTVFLLAGLIPLGTAFDNSGAAELTANALVSVIETWGILPILIVIGLLSMFFSLFMSNVAATVLLVPLVILMGESFGVDPAALALLVAVSASNSFVLPTHQVNAFIMTPGGYRNADYLRAGSLMSVIFLVISVTMIWLFYI
ncbi:SLC13 family permease [Salisediminibacterium halotolerans]|uniref:SLC13 family permease n=1 Tax=Salisediminibacterium halotolerans TaxID=517425 RepID=UPI000EAF9C4A|nr:SLC13 family permease [Salisediminibacterium halotolerans]RLJ73157.1 TrkA family protein [Actinophytocola xinjiangensis]RPE86579.1 TrkA family protein [Salisediminibacterium halotolerans]TWG33954.1 TrkA family protein [Salisediminibacterium halotolerans]GEL06637.1 SLC13 family permease [Salisediminibacterium halotolerans]